MKVGLFMCLGFCVLLLSCKGKEESIPSYLQINSLVLNTTIAQGNNINDFKGAYVFADGELLGVFELPATIPVHRIGSSKITVSPVIRENASGEKLYSYSSILPADSTMVFTPGKITTIHNFPVTYRTNTFFAWLEDFEDNSSTLVGISVPKGDTSLITTDAFDLMGRFSGPSKMYTALIQPSDTLKYMDLGSFKTFQNVPFNGSDVFLEFDIKTDVDIMLGIERTNSTKGSEYVPFLAIYSTGGNWKRIYANLVYETGGQPEDTEYQILFSGTFGPSLLLRKVQIDNIRLSYNN